MIKGEKMNTKRTGFGTRTGFALASAGSAIGLGNLWGFPYKVSSHGGAAYLFIYIACIALIGAVALIAEFNIGKNGKANAVTTYKKISPSMGWFGVLAIVIPFIIICYYYVLGGYTMKYAFNSYVGNAGNFHTFSANIGDVLLHTFVFAAIAYSIIAAGVHDGIEKASKILMPSILFFLVVIIIFVVSLGEGVNDGLKYYLKPDFSSLTSSAVLSAMGQAFFSLSLGCGAMVAYSSYASEKIDIKRATVGVCVIDVLISLLIGVAIFPAIFHYSEVSGTPVTELGIGGEGGGGMMFEVMSMVFEEIPVIGRSVSLLFFAVASFAAVTSVISIIEVVTQFIIQRHKIFRGRAAMIVTVLCFLISVPVAISFGSEVNSGTAVTVFGVSLFDYLETLTSTILMPICALLSCVGAAKLIRAQGRAEGLFCVMVSWVTPALIIAVEVLGIYNIVMPEGKYSSGGMSIVISAFVIVAICFLVYNLRMKKEDTGTNESELEVMAMEAEKRRNGIQRGWSHPE